MKEKARDFFNLKSVIFVLAFAAAICTLSWGRTYASEVSFDVTYNQTEARAMLDRINDFRTGSEAWYWDQTNTNKVYVTGLSTLEYDYELEKVAMQRAAEIVINWAHTRPDGSSTWSAYSDLGYTYTTCGENIAVGQTSEERVFIAWREDDDDYSGQGHRRNMLNSSFKAVGIACVIVDGTKYWVQEFSGANKSSGTTTTNDSVTEVHVKVTDSTASSLTYTASSVSVNVGETADFPLGTAVVKFSTTAFGGNLNIKNIPEFTSADNTYVSIENGKIKGLKAGTGKIYGKLLGKDVEASVTVTGSGSEPTTTQAPTDTPTAAPTSTPTPAPAQKTSMSDISFTYTDLRTGATVSFNAADGKAKVLLMGGLSSCGNTNACIKSLSAYLPYITDSFDVYVIDIKDNDKDKMKQWLADNGIDSRIYTGCETELSGTSYYTIYQKGVVAAGLSGDGWWTMPMVFYIDKNGDSVVATTGYKNSDEIKGYLSQIVTINEATPEPTATPTATPTVTPTATPTSTPTPTPEPTPVVTPVPTEEPTPIVTPVPTENPTPVVTQQPTSTPTQAPTSTPKPTDKADGTFAGTSFKMTNIGTQKKVVFDGGDGSYKVVVMGGIGSCWNTLDVIDSFGYMLEGVDEVKFYAIDIKKNSNDTISDYLGYIYNSSAMIFASEGKVTATGDKTFSEFKTEILKAAGVKTSSRKANYVLPVIAFIDPNGNIAKATTGYYEYSALIDLFNEAFSGDTSVPSKSGGTTSVTEVEEKSNSSTQKTLKTDALGNQILRVAKVSKGVSENTVYAVVSNKYLKLTGLNSEQTKLVIPSYVKIEGKKYYVKYISKVDIESTSDLTEVTIGKKVTKIYKNAFNGQKKLAVINITAGKLKYIGKNAFKNIAANAVFNITGTEKEFDALVKLIKASGVGSKVTFNRIAK